GEVSQDIAARNRIIISDILDKVHSLGITTFKIDKIDAFFYNGKYQEPVLDLPSNFNLEMTENTHLRAFLNSGYISFLLIKDKVNVKVSGGNFYGYRHLPGNNDADGAFDYLIKIKTGENILIENVKMLFGAEDGLAVESTKHAYETGYVPSKNVIIRGCTFDSSGRNNLSIVDGQDIIVENCL